MNTLKPKLIFLNIHPIIKSLINYSKVSYGLVKDRVVIMSRVVVIGEIMSPSPRDVHLLIPRTCAYATFHGKEKLRLLIGAPQNREIVLDYSGGPTVITSVLKNGQE